MFSPNLLLHSTPNNKCVNPTISLSRSLPSAFPHQPNLGMILNRTYSDPSCLGAAAPAAAATAPSNNLRRTDSNLSMMTDDSSSEPAAAHPHGGAAAAAPAHHQDPPVIATNGTGNQLLFIG